MLIGLLLLLSAALNLWFIFWGMKLVNVWIDVRRDLGTETLTVQQKVYLAEMLISATPAWIERKI